MAAVGPLLPEGATRFDLGGDLPGEVLQRFTDSVKTLRGLESLRFFCAEVLIPLGRAMRPGVAEAVARWRPDVLAVDQQALAGALVARSTGLPWATLATTWADAGVTLQGLDKVLEWFEQQQAALQREAGLEPAAELERSPHLVLVFSTPALIGDTSSYPAQYRFVGPSFAQRRQDVSFPWEALDGRRKLLASLGTLNAERGARLFAAIGEALVAEDLQVVVVAPESMGPFPASFIRRDFVPQIALLPRMDAVLCHGGHNTVCEALAHGLPLILTPIKDDQTVVAQQVADAGAGIRLRFARAQATTIRAAGRAVLDDGRYRAAAGRIRESFAAAGGPARAAELLEELGRR